MEIQFLTFIVHQDRDIYLLFSANILSYKILTHFTPGTFSNVTLKMLTPIFEKINVVYVLEIPVSRLC